jgi:hypothetical protein
VKPYKKQWQLKKENNMSSLADLQPEERGLLIGLPYRVGIWISHADDEEGETDDIREMKALEHIIRSIAKVHESSAFVQQIAQQTLQRKEKWDVWAQHSFDILADCEKAVSVLKANVNDNDLKDYRNTLVQIAETVASAYGEFGMEAEDENVLGAFLGNVVGKLKGESSDQDFMNISPAEEAAIERLKTAMKTDD